MTKRRGCCQSCLEGGEVFVLGFEQGPHVLLCGTCHGEIEGCGIARGIDISREQIKKLLEQRNGWALTSSEMARENAAVAVGEDALTLLDARLRQQAECYK